MTNVNVNLDTLRQAIDNVESCLNQLDTIMTEIEQYVPKLQGSWHQFGSDDWYTTQIRFNNSFLEGHSAGRQLRHAMEGAHFNYHSINKSLSDLWSH